jgi:hypothetical protein
MPQDEGGFAVQVPSHLVFQDSATTPIVSPHNSDGTTALLALKVPNGALYLCAICRTQYLRFGDGALGGGSGAGYACAEDGEWLRIPVAGRQEETVYLKTVTSAGVAQTSTEVEFFFEMLAITSD